jgi:hypothetical protein
MLQHYLYQDRRTFVRLFMVHGEDADYLRLPYGPGWQERMADLDILLEGIATRAHARDVPVLLLLAPSRIQLALLSEDGRQYGADPFGLGRAIGQIAARHRIRFVDMLETFATEPAPERFVYPVDGHMDGAGSGVFAAGLLNHLTQDDLPPFATCRTERPTTLGRNQP